MEIRISGYEKISDVPSTGTSVEAPAPAGAKRGTGAGAKNRVFPKFYMEFYENKLKITEAVAWPLFIHSATATAMATAGLYRHPWLLARE